MLKLQFFSSHLFTELKKCINFAVTIILHSSFCFWQNDSRANQFESINLFMSNFF